MIEVIGLGMLLAVFMAGSVAPTLSGPISKTDKNLNKSVQSLDEGAKELGDI